MRVLAVNSSVGSAVTGFVGMVSCGEWNYKAQTQSVDGQWLSVGSVPFSMGRSVFLRAAGKTNYQIYMGTCWRAWVDLRRRLRRTGQAQKERGPGFVGTSIKKSESTVDCARQHTLACAA
jgi:hypothetical protein